MAQPHELKIKIGDMREVVESISDLRAEIAEAVRHIGTLLHGEYSPDEQDVNVFDEREAVAFFMAHGGAYSCRVGYHVPTPSARLKGEGR